MQGCNSFGCTAFKQSSTVGLAPPVPASINVPASDADGTFSVSWSSASGATSYTASQQVNGGTWSQIYSGSGTSLNRSALGVGQYRYAARACNSHGCSAYRYSGTVNRTPDVPVLSTPSSSTSGSFTVSWTAETGATSYELQRQLNNGSFSTVYSSSGTSVAQSGLGEGNWDYRIRACASFGCSAYSSEQRTLVELPPAMPATLSSPSTDMDGSYTVSWSSSTGATRYELQESVLSGSTWGSYTSIHNASGTSKALVRNDGNYRYRVRACKAVACSAWNGPAYTEVGVGIGECSLQSGGGMALGTEPEAGGTDTTADSGTTSTGMDSLATDSSGDMSALAGPGC